jgi:hypothetical protein
VKSGIPRRFEALRVIDAHEIEVRINRQWRKILNKPFYTNQAFSHGISQKDMSAWVVFKVFYQLFCKLKGVKEFLMCLTYVIVGSTLVGGLGNRR